MVSPAPPPKINSAPIVVERPFAEAVSALRSLMPQKSPGANRIHLDVLKELAQKVAPELTKLSDGSLEKSHSDTAV